MTRGAQPAGRNLYRGLNRLLGGGRSDDSAPKKGNDHGSLITHGRQEACFLAVASGKGGTGKSFFATNLAVAMHDAHRRVTLGDCDFGMANDHLLLGVNPERSIQHYFAGSATLEQIKLRTPYGP